MSELQFTMTKAGLSTEVTDNDWCYYPDSFAPSVNLADMTDAANYNGASSSCNAVPSGDVQRLCCCSNSGCATA